MIVSCVHISEMIGNRFDPMFYNPLYTNIIRTIKNVHYKTLGEIAVFSSESWNQKSYFNYIFPYIEISAIDILTGEVKEIDQVPIYNAPSRAKKIVRKDDIIISTTRPNRGAISLIEENLCIASTGFAVIRDISACIIRKYLYIVLRIDCILEQMAQRSAGGNYPAITECELKKILLPVPPIHIQEKIINIYTKAQEAKQAKDEEAKFLLDNIDSFLLEVLGIASNHQHNKKSIFSTSVSNLIGQRFDVSSYKEHFEMLSNKYPNRKLSSLVEMDPAIKFVGFDDDTTVSFIPMECIDEKYGEISEQREIPISKIKGYTKFEEGDLLWAKITPCMQNGKSSIARNLKNGVGCGSTEYYVIRPKTEDLLVDYVYLILRHSEVLKAAQGSFGGSAGQQRVSSQYMKSIVIPFPSKDIQQSIVDVVKERKQRAKQLQMEGTVMFEKAKQEIEKLILGKYE